MSPQMMLTPASLKAKFISCLGANYLFSYPCKTVLRPFKSSLQFRVAFCPDLKAKKPKATDLEPQSKPAFNPFLPVDANLFLEDLGDEYSLIFNKFCVFPEHLLIVTKEFIPQTAPFTQNDFDAVQVVLNALRENRPFAFYNSSADAGASQPHRHFQVVGTEGNGPIIEEAIAKVENVILGKPFLIPEYQDFKHACIKYNCDIRAIDAFNSLASFLKLTSETPFNLIWTLDWILLVPRRKEHTDDGLVSLNALPFAGYVLVMDEGLLESIDLPSAFQQVTLPQ